MKKQILLLCLSLLSFMGFSQKYITKNGHVKFFSSAPMEDIEAHNNQVNCALDASNGNMVFKILIKSFEFKKALMQEHFNENYLESDKFPNATFSGKVEDIESVNFNEDGEYEVVLAGILTIHGISHDVKEKGKLIVNGDVVKGKSVFKVKVADYDIRIPKTVIDKVADEIAITVDVKLKKI